MKKHLYDLKAPTKELSPFENKDLNVGLTFLHSVNLEISVLEEFENWIEEFPRATLYLYGTVNVALNNWNKPSSNEAFRFLFPPEYGLDAIGAPFLVLQAAASESFPNTTEIKLFTSRLFGYKQIRLSMVE